MDLAVLVGIGRGEGEREGEKIDKGFGGKRQIMPFYSLSSYHTMLGNSWGAVVYLYQYYDRCSRDHGSNSTLGSNFPCSQSSYYKTGRDG